MVHTFSNKSWMIKMEDEHEHEHEHEAEHEHEHGSSTSCLKYKVHNLLSWMFSMKMMKRKMKNWNYYDDDDDGYPLGTQWACQNSLWHLCTPKTVIWQICYRYRYFGNGHYVMFFSRTSSYDFQYCLISKSWHYREHLFYFQTKLNRNTTHLNYPHLD